MGLVRQEQGIIPVYSGSFSFFLQGILHQRLFSISSSIYGQKISEITSIKTFTAEQFVELGQALRETSFGNLVCLEPNSPVLLLREWLRLLLHTGCLRYEDGRTPTDFELDFHEGLPVITDKRDGEVMPYIPPPPVQYKTYKQAITGKTIVVQEGKVKSERQLFQEALFSESLHFIQNQLFVVFPDKQVFEKALSLLEQELCFFRYFTLESEYSEMVSIPAFFQGVQYGSCLKARFAIDYPWKLSVKNGAEKWIEYKNFTAQIAHESSLKNAARIQEKIRSVKNHFLMENIRKEEDFQCLTRLRSRYHQAMPLNDLFGGFETKENSVYEQTIKSAIQDLERRLGLFQSACVETILEPGLTFPMLTDDAGIFRGFDVIWGDYGSVSSPEKIVNRKFWHFLQNGGLDSGGITGIKLPEKWFSNATYQPLRHYWLQHFPMLQVWRETNKIGVITGEKHEEGMEVTVKNQNGDYKHTVHAGYFLKNPDKPVRFSHTYEEQTFMLKIEKLPQLLGKYCTLFQGPKIHKKEISTEGLLFITSEEIEPFGITAKSGFLGIEDERIAFFKQFVPGQTVFFIQKADGTLAASLTNQPYAFDMSVIALSFELEAVALWALAFLNAALIQRYIRLCFSDKTTAVSPRKLMEILSEIPFFCPDSDTMEEINILTKKTIHEKNNKNTGTISCPNEQGLYEKIDLIMEAFWPAEGSSVFTSPE